MKTHDIVQGSPEWHTHRATHFNASDAPAMMGVSPYKTRAQLLHELHTGCVPEVDAATQRRFDDGHRFEALARPLAEEIIGQELYPVVGSDGELSASFDGLTMGEDIGFEHKTLNDNLRACMRDEGNGYDLPMQYQIQMEQQLMVSRAERILFMASKWTGDELIEERHCWYQSDPKLRAAIEAGWKQFAIDLTTYVPSEIVMAPVAKPQMSLPAVSIRVNGSIALVDNLQAFGTALTAYVERINKEPQTDQDFADLEATVKALKSAEEALDAAENGALAQTESIDSMRRTVGLYRETARTNRLLVEKLVKVEKENRRTKIIGDAVAAFHSHMRGLNERLGKPYMPTIQAEFQQVVKGLKSIDSMKDKVANELARCKIEANSAADRIQSNLTTLRELAADHAFLFADTSVIVLKANDDLTALVKSRIADHKAAEAAKEEATRERIRKEEQDKLASEQAEARRMAMSEIQGIQQQVIIAECGRSGVRRGGTIECIRDTLAETEAWVIEESNFGALTATAQAAKDAAIADIRKMILDYEVRASAAAVVVQAQSEVHCNPPAAVVEAVKPQTEMVRFGSIVIPREQIDKTWPAKPAPVTPPDLKLGQIAERLGFTVTAEFLRTLGFEPAATDRASKLYYEADFPRICAALVEHINTVCETA